MPYFDRFDIVEAWYVFLTSYHDGRGRGRTSYGRLSHLLTRFKPHQFLCDETDLTENGREIYDQLVEREECYG